MKLKIDFVIFSYNIFTTLQKDKCKKKNRDCIINYKHLKEKKMQKIFRKKKNYHEWKRNEEKSGRVKKCMWNTA